MSNPLCRRCDLPLLVPHSSGLCGACCYIVRLDVKTIYREKQDTLPGETIMQFITRVGHDVGFVVCKKPKKTQAKPGSALKRLVLSERLDRAEELFIEEDRALATLRGRVPWTVPVCEDLDRPLNGELSDEQGHFDNDYWGYTSG